MEKFSNEKLTERQQREIEYHKTHAEKAKALVDKSVNVDIATQSARRWWNAYWHTYTRLKELDVKDKDVLIVGCGFGNDAMRLRALGARVSAFDISQESIAVAKERAKRQGWGDIDFDVMPSEKLSYDDRSFNIIVAVDILHHVDIPKTFSELLRVAKPGCTFVCDEIYTHSFLTKIRNSRFVNGFLYPRMVEWIYGEEDPYITEDERKLDESERNFLLSQLKDVNVDYFNLFIGRVIPDKFQGMAKLDRVLLRLFYPLGSLLAARFVMTGTMRN